jgi:dihydrofolate reductase
MCSDICDQSDHDGGNVKDNIEYLLNAPANYPVTMGNWEGEVVMGRGCWKRMGGRSRAGTGMRMSVGTRGAL